MGIKKPAYHLKSKFNLPSFRHRMEGPVGGRNLSPELNLTALIDVFSVIILFLVSTFSATGEIIFADRNIKLPTAKHAFLLQRSPILTVTEQGISLEGLSVGDNTGIEDKLEEFDWELPMAKQKLREYRAFFEAADAGVPFPARVIIQADRDLTFLYLKRAMFTLVQEGYVNIDLVVRGEASIRPPETPSADETL